MSWETRKERWDRWKQQWLPQTLDQKLLILVMVITVVPLIVVPLGAMFYFSFLSEFPSTQATTFTIAHYQELFLGNTDLLIEITANQLVFSIGAVGVALVIGLSAAILFEKYIESSGLRMLMLLPYAMPSIASATGWVSLLGRAGILNRLLMNVFHLASPPIDIYSMQGMIFAEGIHSAPLAFLLLSPAIKSISSELEEASYISGASKLRTYKDIIFPLIMPSFISITIFLFARSLALVSVPAVLGIPGRILTYGTVLPVVFLGSASLSYPLAIAFSVYLIIISALLMVLYYQYTSQEEKYSTVTGQSSGSTKQYDITRSKRYFVKSSVSVYILIAGLLPLFAIFWDSIATGPGFTLNLNNLSLVHYTALFDNSATGVTNWWRSFRNTLTVGVVTSTVAILLGFLISYSTTLKLRGSNLLAYLASVPLAVPSIALGLAYLVVFIRTPLYGTIGILLVAYIGKAIPTAMRYSSPALLRIGKENIEASTVSGYGELLTFRKTISRLVASDMVAGWMHIFVFVIRDVALAIILYSFGSELISIDILFALENGYRKNASAMGVILTLLAVIPYMYLQYWRREKLTEAVEL